MRDYRQRIYDYYVRATGDSRAPSTIEDLKPRAAFLKALVRDHFPSDRDAVIVDLGCGHGALMHFAQLAGYRNITGIDVSPQQVEQAERLSIEGVQEGDLLDKLVSLADQSVDLIIAFDVIEHFGKNELMVFLDHVYRVLRNGGRWIIHAPNGESPFAGRIRYGDFSHELAFTRGSMTQLLKASGFADVACYEDVPIPHGLKSSIRWLLWKLIRAALRVYLAVETGSGEKECIFSQNFLTVAVK